MLKLILLLSVLGFFYWPALGLALVLMMTYVMDNDDFKMPTDYSELLPEKPALAVFAAMCILGFFIWQAWLITLLMAMYYTLSLQQAVVDSEALKSMKTVDSMGTDELRQALTHKF